MTDRRRIQTLLPRLAAPLAAFVGLVNVASALTPNIRWRGRLLLQVEPVEAIRIFHAAALPVGMALLLVSPYLLKRRRRAWQAAIVLMVALGALNLAKGLDFEEALVTWVAAGILLAGRPAFAVRHDPVTLRSAVWRVPLLGAVAILITAVAAWISLHQPSSSSVLRETWDLLTWQAGPLHFERHRAFHHLFAWIPLAVHLIQISTLLAMAYVVFRPLAAPRSLPDPQARLAAAALVRAHGSDTLSFFKLRGDKQYLFSTDRRAFVGYRIESGVMLLSGDPVGPADAIPGLLEELRSFAEARALRIGAVGASEAMCRLYEQIGLRSIYLGDEAVVETGRFSLEGRPIRKVRQSVTRLAKAGYVAELLPVRELEPETLGQVEHVLELGRQGVPERGFSMQMDSIAGEFQQGTLVVLARDGEGRIRGVLHFVPVFGREAVSLSFMRRDPGTPNGLTEFMVARAIELLRERGVQELSLNFATFARWMHSPERPLERLLGKLVALANPFFQIESLYRFNAKFFPRWEPRFLVYEGPLGLPRAGLAAMWAEGQLPKPTLRRAARTH
jgi:lysyl-tRNA synthetase class 2